MKIFKISILFILLFFLLTCTDNSQKQKEDNIVISPINPNGDSELALLMRAMFDDVQRMQAQIEKGETPTPTVDFEKMFTVQATEPDKQASQKFKSFGAHHLNMLKDLQTASPDQRLELYEDLVESCMTCHRALCPGPTVKIKKLYTKK